MEVFEGQVLAGKYQIERVLGRGGMGVVVAAMHLQLGERVALKFLLPEALHNPEAVARFDREARAAVRIKSEHVARVSDVGTLENGAPYMVMEHLQGVDLSEWLVQRGALPVEQAVEFVLQACEAIAEAHTLGIVHRDLKPANLFVIERPDGTLAVKVLDFGISKTTGLGSSGGAMTKTSAAMGSPLYMSPEQMQSAKDVDPRGDIWALGVVLYELVSGRTPFLGESMAELVLKVVTSAPVALRGVCPQAPPALEAVLLKCLQKDRGARFQSICELSVALHEFGPRRSKVSVERIQRLMQRAGMSVNMTQLPASSDGTLAQSVAPAPQTMASWGQTNPPVSRRRRVIFAAAALIAVPIFAVGAIALTRSGGHNTASGALPPGPSVQRPAEPPPIRAPSVIVDPVVSAPAVEPSSHPASAVPAVSATSAAHAVTQASTNHRPATPPHTVTLSVAKPAALEPAPEPAVSKLIPSAVKNPLKMPMQ